MNGIKSLDQRRASHAWDQLQAFLTKTAGTNADNQKARAKYGVHARKLPMRIMASGLGQSLAFLLAKNYCPDLLLALGDWVLSKRDDPPKKLAVLEPKTLLHELIGRDSEFAQMATAEVLAYLRWMTRFVEAEKLTTLDAEEV